jgi:hypothetical protein
MTMDIENDKVREGTAADSMGEWNQRRVLQDVTA